MAERAAGADRISRIKKQKPAGGWWPRGRQGHSP